MALLQPEKYFASLSRIDIRFDLTKRGYTCVLLDIDNTVRSRESGGVPRDVRRWLARARDAGVKTCLLSNNWHASAHDLAEELEMPIVAKACKPLPLAFRSALHKMGCSSREAVMVGDQLLTDVLGAHLAGIAAYLVAPLSEVNIRSAAWQRAFEARVLGGAIPEGATCEQAHCERSLQ